VIVFRKASKIALNFSELLLSLANPQFSREPFRGFTVMFAVVASAYAVTQRNNVGSYRTRAIGRRNRYPMIHRQCVPQSTRTPANGTAMIEVIERVLPVLIGEGSRETPFARFPIEFVSSLLLSVRGVIALRVGVLALCYAWFAQMSVPRSNSLFCTAVLAFCLSHLFRVLLVILQCALTKAALVLGVKATPARIEKLGSSGQRLFAFSATTIYRRGFRHSELTFANSHSGGRQAIVSDRFSGATLDALYSIPHLA